MHLADAFIQATYSGYTFHFFVSMWEFNPKPFALLTQCSTTEPQEQKWHGICSAWKCSQLSAIWVIYCKFSGKRFCYCLWCSFQSMPRNLRKHKPLASVCLSILSLNDFLKRSKCSMCLVLKPPLSKIKGGGGTLKYRQKIRDRRNAKCDSAVELSQNLRWFSESYKQEKCCMY